MKKTYIYQFIASLMMLFNLSACGNTNTKSTNAASAASATSAASAASSANENTAVNTPVDAEISKKISQNLTERMRKAFGDNEINIQKVNHTPIKGLYEAVVGSNKVVYTDENGKYLLVGNMLDIDNKVSLTEKRMAELSKIDFSQLPLDKAIKVKRGDGKRILAVFSDPDCPYCKKLELELAKLDNVTIYTFIMPIPSLHPDAQKKAVQIWCQPKPDVAWNNWMLRGKMPPTVKDCTNPIADVMALGVKLGFDGTPTLAFPSGRTISGLVPKEALDVELDKNQK
jgi:thiol:disulfide interchange protein DsbC